MKNFLYRLKKERKLEIIEPSEEVKNAYIKKSESNLISAKILFENNKLEEATSLIYYSMYNLLIALFFKVGIKCENHSASIILLKDLFNIDNSDISFAKKERINKQYYPDSKITKKEVEELIHIAENFNNILIDFISKLNNEQIEKYRIKLRESFK